MSEHERHRLDEAVIDLCWRVTPYGETDDGDIANYIVSKGTVHRLIAAAQAAGVPAAFRNGDVSPPPDPPLDSPSILGVRRPSHEWHDTHEHLWWLDTGFTMCGATTHPQRIHRCECGAVTHNPVTRRVCLTCTPVARQRT